MPNLDPQELANTVLDQAMTIRQMGDALRERDGQIAMLRDGWNTLAMVKERYDELKAEAEAAEAKKVAAEMTAEKPLATTTEPNSGIAAEAAPRVQSEPRGGSCRTQSRSRKRAHGR